MREIKFRAMAVVNQKHNNIKVGDFVYGSYIESGCDAPCIIFGDGDQIEIDRETLGQLTGLIDKDGVKIYEGHLLMNKHDTYKYVKVEFIGGGFVGHCNNDKNWFLTGINSEEFKIIGNIHQNPELLINRHLDDNEG